MPLGNETIESGVAPNAPHGAAAPERRLRWTDCVNLEARLHADEAWPPEELHARDRAIGARTGARELSDRAAVIAWLDSLTVGGSSDGAGDAGDRARHWREQLVATLTLLGFALGALVIVGWLGTARHTPVNVVDLWPLLIGSQVAFVALWLFAAVPAFARWPIVGPFHALMRALLAWLPRAGARLLGWISRDAADTGKTLLAEMQRLDWIYGRMRFWLLARISQSFAIAFNIGMLVAFIVVPTIDDPAFGWRSRLLDEDQVIVLSDALSAPYAWLWPEARPSEETVRATRYSSVDSRYTRDSLDNDAEARAKRDGLWAAWWPFILASLIAYGLLPRVLYWACAWIGMRRALAAIPFDRPEIGRLTARLRQRLVATQADAAETGMLIDAAPFSLPTAKTLAQGRMRGVVWASVSLSADALSALLAARFGAEPTSLATIGGSTREADGTVLADLQGSNDGAGVYVVMASWEPPVGDQIDFLRTLRTAIGSAAPIVVALHNLDPNGENIAPTPEQLLVWRRRTARLGDPSISADGLVAGDVATDPVATDPAATDPAGSGDRS
jgi:hypothetical protein